MARLIDKDGIQYIEFLSNEVISINQKIWSFFVCKMTPRDLKFLAKEDINRYENLDEIQRELRKWRVKEIHEFIYKKDYATFPNSFIVSVSDDAEYTQGWKLLIPYRKDEAYILDWQHRLAWFKDYDEEFEIIVSVYIWLNKFHQAMIFANINWEQVKVNKSLVRSLYGFSEKRSPETVTYSIIKLLNEQPSSPWKWGIKILWKWDWILSLSSFFDELLNQIWWVKKDGRFSYNGVFSDLYKNDWTEFRFTEEDSIIYYVLEDYYNSIKDEFTEEWNNSNFILNKTTWFYWFFKLLVDIVKDWRSNKIEFEMMNKNYFDWYIRWIRKKIEPLKNDNYKAGWVWQKKLYHDLKNVYSGVAL